MKEEEKKKMLGERERDQYSLVMICFLCEAQVEQHRATPEIRERGCVCVHKWLLGAFLLLRAVVRKRKRLGLSCCLLCMCAAC